MGTGKQVIYCSLETGLNSNALKLFSQKKTYPSAAVGQVNPPKFEKCDDMVNLTYLNDASVFHNLEGRYKAKLIHTCKYIQIL